MKTRRVIRTAFRSLSGSPLRTALTALGVVIGVAAVVAVIAIGEGARHSAEANIRALGTNLLTVTPDGTPRRRPPLSDEDALSLEGLPGVTAVAYEIYYEGLVSYEGESGTHSVVGVGGDYFTIRAIDIARGVALFPDDERDRARVAVIGANVAHSLFGERNPVGERIQIRGTGFRVVGVMAPKGEIGGPSPDDIVIVPAATHRSVIANRFGTMTVIVKIVDDTQSDAVKGRIESLLRLRHGLADGTRDDFKVRSQAALLEALNESADVFTALLGAVAAVSLVVGGIGIMNIMLVSVRERTREIGVRIAIGARRSDVLKQFLVESMVVAFGGGAVGVLLGFVSAYAMARAGGWDMIVPPYAILLGCFVSITVGLVFGVGPARHASRLDPVDALRQE